MAQWTVCVGFCLRRIKTIKSLWCSFVNLNCASKVVAAGHQIPTEWKLPLSNSSTTTGQCNDGPASTLPYTPIHPRGTEVIKSWHCDIGCPGLYIPNDKVVPVLRLQQPGRQGRAFPFEWTAAWATAVSLPRSFLCAHDRPFRRPPIKMAVPVSDRLWIALKKWASQTCHSWSGCLCDLMRLHFQVCHVSCTY